MHAVHIPMAIPPESMQIIVIQAAAYKETTAKELIRKSAGPMLATVLLAMASPMAAAQWMAGSTVEAVHNDNVTHSPLPEDVLSDNSVEVALWRSLHVQLADYTSLQLQGTLTRHQFQHFAGLSSTSLSGSAEFSHKFGVGAEIPVLSFTTLITQVHRPCPAIAHPPRPWLPTSQLKGNKPCVMNLNNCGGLNVRK